jgi:K(+)-stimulated pyrophosphate-energized sodium pump
LNPYSLLGFLCGGAVIYWFTGASMQAVTTGAYRAVMYIKNNIKLDEGANLSASTESSKEVVKICTQYAQKGMFNIFIAIFCFALAFAFYSSPSEVAANATLAQKIQASLSCCFFISYLIAIAVFGLFQAIFMANAGGCWDNAKKVVEVDLKEKGTALHAAAVIGDTVGDPYKDTSSVALNPIIKFTTLFGLLAMEMSLQMKGSGTAILGSIFFVIALVFVYRSFYNMRIPVDK